MEALDFASGKVRLLVVEDDPIQRALMREDLTSLGQVDAMGDSESAIARLVPGGASYAAVVVDLGLPAGPGQAAEQEQGLRVVTAVRHGQTTTPVVVVCSGNMTDALRAKLRTVGVGSVLMKPFSTRDLVGAVTRLLQPDHS
ncbi:MAG: response regulator [Candidatus Latescibacterota bacterium]|jgi:CheY-like chemotaxis protein